MRKFPGHLLLVTLEDPFDPGSWSGTAYNMRMALESRIERVSVLSKLKPKRTAMHALLRAALGARRYPLYLTKAAQKQFARETEAAIRAQRPDAVLSISTHCLLYLENPGVPVFMATDAPWMTWKKTYGAFEQLPLLGERFAKLEAKAARRCARLIFSSKWAVEEARKLYGVSADRLRAQPLGANWLPKENNEELIRILQAKPHDELRLLFVGKDWERKGGPLAIEIARGLRDAGAGKVRLDIVGCNPPVPADMGDVATVHGLLRQSRPDEEARLRELFLASHFLVVPTRAECFGVVFAEAHAFGLPAVSRGVDAVPSIIQDGETGIIQAKDDPAFAYVERILALTRNREAYLRMARAARARYEENLNWQAFADAIADEMELAARRSEPAEFA